jgi:hypothetical protein
MNFLEFKKTVAPLHKGAIVRNHHYRDLFKILNKIGMF